MFQEVRHQDNTYAIIIRKGYQKDGMSFFTPDSYSQQLAYMNRPKDYEIDPHLHNKVSREVEYTLEFLYIKSGKVKIDFYQTDQTYFSSETLLAGDCVLLTYGGHGFTMLEHSEIIEVKQGPYVGENKDKIRFKKSDSIQ